MEVNQETPNQPDVIQLLKQSYDYMASLYPPESNHMVEIDTLLKPNARFLVARLDDIVVGCGALVLESDGSAEIKSMFVDPNIRKRGIGHILLECIQNMALFEDVRILRLETGVKNFDAINLYHKFGFSDIGPFGEYKEDPLSVFMEKNIVE